MTDDPHDPAVVALAKYARAMRDGEPSDLEPAPRTRSRLAFVDLDGNVCGVRPSQRAALELAAVG